MERTTIEQAKALFGFNFIGIEEIKPLFQKMGLDVISVQIPTINYSIDDLKSMANDYLLVLGIPSINGTPLSIATFREVFGVNPDIFEPCLYNQDWYMHEDFIHCTLDLRWYLIRKSVYDDSRAVDPSELIDRKISFPSAVLCTYVFFAFYFARHEYLWLYDFIWCSDTDHNGDRIYVGKYCDIDKVNKNGFSIHRHLALRMCYAGLDYY